MNKLLGLPSKLSELLPDKMELGQNGLFIEFGSGLAIQANIG